MTQPETIICLSSQSWDDGMWTNKQHIMSRLAKKHRVIHVDYGLRPLPAYAYRRLRKKPSDALHPLRMLIDGVQYRHDSLYIADSYNPVWAGVFGHGSPIRDFATFDLKTIFLKRFLKKKGITDPIIWVYHPGYADAVERLPRKLLVYDCVDNYAAFPTYKDDPDWLLAREERLCRAADCVFTTSRELYELKSPFNPQNTHLVHNVGDAEHFKKALDPATEVAPEIRELEKPVIGFVGAVSDYKLNAEWLLAAADRHPEWNIAIVGPVGRADPSTDVRKLVDAPNIHLLGLRDYEVLPAYLKGFDVAVIPYRINEATRSVFPIKFFEFLASGTPTVISNLPALEEFYDAVRIARDKDEFIAQCEAALTQPDDNRQARIALAEQHSWPARIATMMGHIERKLIEKSSATHAPDSSDARQYDARQKSSGL
jgi:glycosyltransferase involved in cell wall biosynthesis